MAANEPTALVGVFADRAQAERAMDELAQAGFRPEHMEVTGPGEQPEPVPVQAPPGLRDRGSAQFGAILGAIVGGLLGTLAATGAFPGVGQLFAGGGLAAVVGVLVGGLIGGVLGWLIGLGLSETDHGFYVRELRSGRTLLTVHGNGPAAEAGRIMRRHGAVRVRPVLRVPALRHG